MDAFTDTELGRRGHAFAEAVAAHLAGNLGFVRLDAVPDKVAPGHAVALDLAGPEIPDLGPLAVAAAYAHEGGGPEFPEGAVLRAVVFAEDLRGDGDGGMRVGIRLGGAPGAGAPVDTRWTQTFEQKFGPAHDVSQRTFDILTGFVVGNIQPAESRPAYR